MADSWKFFPELENIAAANPGIAQSFKSEVVELLLANHCNSKTKSIIFATSEYDHGPRSRWNDEMDPQFVLEHELGNESHWEGGTPPSANLGESALNAGEPIKRKRGRPRKIPPPQELPAALVPGALKSKERKFNATRKNGEVFTPSWICSMQNMIAWNLLGIGVADFMDPDVSEELAMLAIDAKVVEPFCGEAPYLAFLYDVVEGKSIHNKDKFGILDAKLRMAATLARRCAKGCEGKESDVAKWRELALQALKSVYAFDSKGDNVFLARRNLLRTLVHADEDFTGAPTDPEFLMEALRIISRNVWQMEAVGLAIPLQGLDHYNLGLLGASTQPNKAPGNWMRRSRSPIRITDWQKGTEIPLNKICAMADKGKRRFFDLAVGNPPYQLINRGKGYGSNPVYHIFIDLARELAAKGTLIHPARFLFNAGKTPREWNERMLADPAFKIEKYWDKSKDVFPSVLIMGGLVISSWDVANLGEPTGSFMGHPLVKSILQKVKAKDGFLPFSPLVHPRQLHRMATAEALAMREEAGATIAQMPLTKKETKGLPSNAFISLKERFRMEPPQDAEDGQWLHVQGMIKRKRTSRWTRRELMLPEPTTDMYKVLVPKSNGNPAVGRAGRTMVIGLPVVAEPGEIHTDTFLTIGGFATREEAEACLKYIKSRFARTLISTLKVTQDNARKTWANVPLQNFGKGSDIDWNQGVDAIDEKLFEKYGLTREERSFLMEAVREMG